MFFKILLSLMVLFQADTILVDRIAAVVNEEMITLTDIDKAVQFYPLFRKAGDSEEAYYGKVLQELITYKIVYLEYKDDFVLTAGDYEEVQAPIIEKLGSLDKLMNLLRGFDMEWSDFKEFIKEKVVYEKVLKEKFQVKLDVDFREIENFYNEQYLPLQKSLDLTPRTLIEMTPLIEKYLSRIRIQDRLSDWFLEIASSYRVENKLKKESE